ncbi:MAG: SDR family NAD(P)-dependent oxidoreductase [Prolixibacteraceae bacterium]
MNVLITGTGSGLGYGLAKHYLNEGHIVYGISRKIKDEQKQHPDFRFLMQDISLFREVETNLLSFLKGVNLLDLVILNAGILNEIKDLKETSLDEIKKVMDVNVWSNKILIESLFKTVKQIDQVVAISSGAAVSGSRGWNAYSLSKATLNMLINLYSKEYAETHFCALAPGLIDTKMQDYIYNLPEEKEYPAVKKLKQAKKSGSMPTIEEAAEINAKAIEKLKARVDSGSFADVRSM